MPTVTATFCGIDGKPLNNAPANLTLIKRGVAKTVSKVKGVPATSTGGNLLPDGTMKATIVGGTYKATVNGEDFKLSVPVDPNQPALAAGGFGVSGNLPAVGGSPNYSGPSYDLSTLI